MRNKGCVLITAAQKHISAVTRTTQPSLYIYALSKRAVNMLFVATENATVAFAQARHRP
jgi:hypothetical protein